MRFSAVSKAVLIAAALLAISSATLAEQHNAAVQSDKKENSERGQDIRVQLARKLPGAKPEDVHATQIPGMYEISLGGSTAYISADGKYLIAGDLYDIANKTNLTETRRTEKRLKALAALNDADTIIFSPLTTPKHTITVFTDMDCGYCRKLHSEIAEINRLGIRVRYAAYPRSGPGTESWAKAEGVWCAKDRRDALTRAKLGQAVPPAKCGATPVASEYQLGESVGVNGTPAIFTETGAYVSGYLPAQKLAAYLDELQQSSGNSPQDIQGQQDPTPGS